MTVQPISDPSTPIGDVLARAGDDGVLLESEGQGRYALLPLDDDLMDYLIERSPELRLQCSEIRKRMDAGRSRTHEEVRRELLSD